jgi:transposase
MKQEIQLQLEVIPASVRIHKYVSHVYACRNCEKTGSSNIVIAPGAPTAVIPKSMVSPSLLADIIAKKYVDATPFYRQEQNNKRYGIPVTRNNMCNWSIKVANTYFKFLTNRMKELLYHEPVIPCDETHLEVLNEPGRSAYAKSYVWVTASAEYQKEFRIAWYHYSETRSDYEARRILKG